MGPGADCAPSPEQFDYPAYLTFLKARGHNFIRLWRWEQFKSQAAGGAFHLCMTPQPWLRTGPGTAKDGKPKFDLDKLDRAYFDRLRQRVIDAGNVGIYVGVMFFDGWALHLSPAPNHVEGHPFHAGNNVNSVSVKSIKDYQVLPLDARVQSIQEAYIKRVVETLHDLPNVLYEVANESSGGGSVDENFAKMLGQSMPVDWGNSTAWQYWVIDVVKRYERERGFTSHPMGMTMQFPVADQTQVNEPLYRSAAEWISPGYDDEIFKTGKHPMEPSSPPSRWYADPPSADGKKIIITDTDHYAPGKGDALWAWKAFLRGHHPIYMDFGLISGPNPANPNAEAPGVPSFASADATRYAMGDTRAFAERMQLIAMTPRDDVASTRYALANPGHEYVVLQPAEASEPFTVQLSAGAYVVEWFSVQTRKAVKADSIALDADGAYSFNAPFPGAAVLYIKKQG
jgi:hypothetical protein